MQTLPTQPPAWLKAAQGRADRTSTPPAYRATPAQVSNLVHAAGAASGALQGLVELIRQDFPTIARNADQILGELNRAAWAAIGRPD